MGEEARGIEKVLTAGPAQAQVSVRMLLPILFAVLAVELVAFGLIGKVAEEWFTQMEVRALSWETKAALNSARLHRSVPGLLGAAGALVLLALMCRKGVFDATGRWLCLALILGLATYPVCFVGAVLFPLVKLSARLSK